MHTDTLQWLSRTAMLTLGFITTNLSWYHCFRVDMAKIVVEVILLSEQCRENYSGQKRVSAVGDAFRSV